MSNLTNTEAVGVYQSDIIIQSAIAEAINDLRRNPWLLDYVFAGLTQDTLTSNVFGVKQLKLAKDWFLANQVEVVMNMHANTASYPVISIALLTSEEVENTFADLHYEVKEDITNSYPALTSPFDVLSYTSSTGATVLPDLSVILAPGMVLVNPNGVSYTIQEVTDPNNITLETGLTPNLNGVVIKGAYPSVSMGLEACNFKEVYSIGCHVIDDGKGSQLMWLYSVLKFCLLRYRQSLMEARGFERTQINWQPPKFEIDGADGAQRIISRYCIITGYVREVWPKYISSKVTSTTVLTKESSISDEAEVITTEIDLDSFDSLGNIA